MADEAAAATPEAITVPVSAPAKQARLTLIRPDGSEGERFPLGETTMIGRNSQDPFSNDPFLSPNHAQFTLSAAGLKLKDLNSLNGIYVRMPAEHPMEITQGSVFRIGQEIIRFETIPQSKAGPDGTETMGSPNPGFIGRVCLIIGQQSDGNCYCISPDGMHFGRERGDVIFPDDGYVSGLHCRIHQTDGRVFLTDVGSSNGTFLRISSEVSVASGTMILMGQQLFRADY